MTNLKNIFLLIFLSGFLLVSCKSVQKSESSVTKQKNPSHYADNSSLFIDASKEKILGNTDEAEKLYKKCLEVNPDDDASMYELAKINIGRKEYDNALHYMSKATKIDPTNVYYLTLYASLLQSQKKYNEAIPVYQQVLNLKPELPENYDKLAMAYLYADKPQLAVKVYDELEAKTGVSEGISLKKQSIYLQENKIDNAVDEIQKLIAAYPYESKYYAILAEMYMSHGMSDKAFETYQKIKEIDPDDPYVDISLAEYYRSIGEDDKAFQSLKAGFANPNLDIDSKIQILIRYYTVNEIYSDKKQEAFELAEELIKAHPNDPKAYSMYGDFLYQDKQLEKARDAFKKVISLDNSKYPVWEQLLFTESELQENDSLLTDSKKTIELFPEQPLPYLFAGSAEYQKKNWDKCVKMLEQGLYYVADNKALEAQFYTYLGDVYNQLDDNKKSDESYAKALTYDPDNDYVLNNYAYYLSLRGEKLDTAAKMAKRATELKPSSSNQDTYGWVLYKLGYYKEARTWIEKALDNSEEENPVILEHYGDVLWHLGEKDQALLYWQKAADAGKGSDMLEKKIEQKTLIE